MPLPTTTTELGLYLLANKAKAPGYFSRKEIEPYTVESQYIAKDAFHSLIHGKGKGLELRMINQRVLTEDSAELIAALHLSGPPGIVQQEREHSPHFQV